ncbi:MAG: glucoamylase family protein [Candidatus Omnitrophota bacterium]
MSKPFSAEPLFSSLPRELRGSLVPAVFFWALLSFPFFSGGALAATFHVQAFKTLPKDRSLLSSPQFIVVDDFSAGNMINQRGGLWRTKSPGQGAFEIGIEREDGRGVRGMSLKGDVHLRGKEKAALQSRLNRLDVSRAESLVFRCKWNARQKGPLRLALVLQDNHQRKEKVDFTEQVLSEEEGWKDVTVPMDRFEDLDLNEISLIEIMLLSEEGENRGEIWIDEIAFFGPYEVAFESNRDNLAGFPKTEKAEQRRSELLKIVDNERLLREIARDTWRYFQQARDRKTQLIVDHIKTGDAPLAAGYTSITNVGIDLLATISAWRLGLISKKEAKARVRAVLSTMKAMPQYEGFFYNFYDTRDRSISRSYVSTVDNGWLAVALVVVRQAFPDLAVEASKFLEPMDFSRFLDPENNHFVIGFDVPMITFGNFHYGMLVSEARATSFLAIGKGDIPKSHWWFLYRTPPESWKWQKQTPKGTWIRRGQLEYFQGYYELHGKKFVPTWGGSLFEFLMPTLVLDEKRLAPAGLGLNNRIGTEMHRQYALVEKQYPVWGISPAATGSGRQWKYQEFGVRALGVKGYAEEGVIAPHVSFLALETLPKEAIQNIRKLLEFPGIYGEHGFYDSIRLRNQRVQTQYLALDQGMILLALCNFLEGGALQRYFHADKIARNAEQLLKEDFLLQ